MIKLHLKKYAMSVFIKYLQMHVNSSETFTTVPEFSSFNLIAEILRLKKAKITIRTQW